MIITVPKAMKMIRQSFDRHPKSLGRQINNHQPMIQVYWSDLADEDDGFRNPQEDLMGLGFKVTVNQG